MEDMVTVPKRLLECVADGLDIAADWHVPPQQSAAVAPKGVRIVPAHDLASTDDHGIEPVATAGAGEPSEDAVFVAQWIDCLVASWGRKDDTQAHSLAMKEIARALDRLVGARPTEIRALKGAK